MVNMMRRIAATAIFAALAHGALAQEASKQVLVLRIDAPKLSRALIQLTEQSGTQLIYPAGNKIVELPARALSGRYTLEAAMDELLRGTGLKYEFLDPRTITILDPAAEKARPTRGVATPEPVATPAAREAAGFTKTAWAAAQLESPTVGAGSSAAAVQPAPAASPAPVASVDTSLEEITITGSRVIATGNEAPSPVTVITAEKLLESTPANLGDAINRLPQFAAQTSTRGISAAASNASANTISLRKFGAQRTLILVDGIRVPPTAANGSVDTNIIPQTLVSRVDIVTGGASAVYGSDAVTGVVNFVIDRNFNGLKFNSQYGASNYNDAESWRAGGAFGTPLFDGRGHVEVSFDHRDSGRLQYFESRPEGIGFPTLGGNGTATNPFRIFYNPRSNGSAPGGLITFPTNVPGLTDMTFKADGIATPFIHGDAAAAGIAGLESGGDGSWRDSGSILSSLVTNQYFGRVDFELPHSMHFATQLSYNDAQNYYPYTSVGYTSSYASGNPLIPAPIQALMTSRNVAFVTVNRSNQRDDNIPDGDIGSFSTNVFVTTGLEGKFGDGWKWSTSYSYSRSKAKTTSLNNRQPGKRGAGADVVINPATGKLTCAVLLTAFASNWPGCVPVNLFGPTALSAEASDWLTDPTTFTLTNLMQDVAFSVSGSPFNTWAGPVTAAISGEYRKLSLDNISSADAIALADCRGIANLGDNCVQGTTLLWQSDTTQSMSAKQDVREIAGELLIPLVRDLPLIKSFDLNLAERYTNYSTSGGVQTWKAGAAWEVMDGLRLRSTVSRDIRAPTLTDLFKPVSKSQGPTQDLHTGLSRNLQTFSQGNPDLTPEVSRTFTAGIVYQPNWAPRLSIALDYFDITIKNAIANVNGTNLNNQRECEASNGASIYCSLLVRPLPFSDRSAANYPTSALSVALNASQTYTRGMDVEANYRFQMSSLLKSVPGDFAIRLLGTYQPMLKTQTTSNVPTTDAAGIQGFSTTRINLNLAYHLRGLNIAATERYQSGQYYSDPTLTVDLRGTIPAFLYHDLSLTYTTKFDGHEVVPFLTVENLTNKRPPIAGSNGANAGLFFPSATGFDVIGRYYTAGIRFRM